MRAHSRRMTTRPNPSGEHDGMRFMANSRPGPGVTPEQLRIFFKENAFSRPSWNLVQRRVVVQVAVKTGDVPGVVLFLDVDTHQEAADVVNDLDAVRKGLLTFDLDPIGEDLRL
ncbi:hypothetical protein Q0Z83_017970 [Actinoplanes sichuanensis]|nr:hypothetical protein Q0Z83_017970 [Actinoplanes sichuanensis]